MEARHSTGRIGQLRAYGILAGRYWFDVFPRTRRQLRRWQLRAEQIPEPELQTLACRALEAKRANVEGAAAFATFAPRARRGAAVRALVAFQALCDYLDSVAEQASADPARNAQQLHAALTAALVPGTPHLDYYQFCPHRGDGGYLDELVDACHAALAALPSYPEALAVVRDRVEQAAQYQSLNLAENQGGHERLALWAASQTANGAALDWWEQAASKSTVAILALIGASAGKGLRRSDATAIAAAYQPWVEALHTLLDSVVDQSEDAAAGLRSLVDYYGSSQEAADRLSSIAREALRAARGLPDPATHEAIIAAMVGHYLCPAPPTPSGALVSDAVLATLGALVIPTVVMFRAKRTAHRLGVLRRASPEPLQAR